jgi:multidrug efflux system outer membrane protein
MPVPINFYAPQWQMVSGFVAVLVLGGCAYAPPSKIATTAAVAVPAQWQEAASSTAPEADAAWWRVFDNRELDELVEGALTNNRDLQMLAARLAQAQALSSAAAAERLPRLDGNGALTRGRDSSADPRTERSSSGLRASWELDLFGRLSRASDAASFDAEGLAQGLVAARVALAAEVASAYLELRTLAQRQRMADEAIDLAQQQTLVAQRKFDAGQVQSVELARLQAELALERAQATDLAGLRRVRLHQLTILLGASRTPVLTLADSAPIAAPPPVLPAALLERRPDVLRQARALDAALARVGIARAAVYPQLQLGWDGSRERLASIGGAAAPQSVIGYGVTLSLPVLDGGRIRAQIAAREAGANEAMAEYEKALLVALADAESALAQRRSSSASLTDWRRARDESRVAVERVAKMFQAGMVDQSVVLDARRNYLRAEDGVLRAEGSLSVAAVSLRRAFAGAI